MDYCFGSLTHNKVAGTNIFTQDYKQKKHRIQAVGALGELSDKSDFSLLAVLAKKYAIYYYPIVKNL